MSVETETTIAAAARQISEKAGTDIKRLSDRIPVLEAQLTTNTAERAEIEQARLDDAHTLAVAKEQDDKATQAHNDALSYANYSVGLLAESESTRKALEAETSKKEARRLYEETASLIETREATRAARMNTLEGEYEQARTELTACHAEIATIRRIEQQALAELGQSTYERLQATHESTHLARKAELREQTALANIEEARFLDAALAELHPWPELQQKLKPKEEYQDETTQTMQAYIHLINSLIGDEQGNHLSALQQLPSVRNQYYDFRNLFLLALDDLSSLSIHQHARATTKPTSLLRRRDAMQSLLSEYRKTKQ